MSFSRALRRVRFSGRTFCRPGEARPLKRTLQRAPAVRRSSSNEAADPAGFSLIEVMIVVVIIGLLAAVVTYATSGYLGRAKRERARADIATYSGAIDGYYLANGRYPDNREGLRALAPNFVKVVQNDPWGRPYQYVQPGRSAPFDVICYGADGREGGTGDDADITSADVAAPADRRAPLK